jgi:hypothetical protein
MGSLESLFGAMDELAIARAVGIPHDEARMSYALKNNTVGSYGEFTEVITDYYNYHVGKCVLHGGFLSRTEAGGRAKEILDREYRRQGGDINTAYNDAHDGTSGGLRLILDKLAEQLKAESVERYIRDAFDRYVEPNSWEQKVDIMRQFIAHFGHHLSSSIRPDQPERYAHGYEELVRGYVESLKRTSSIFRRL